MEFEFKETGNTPGGISRYNDGASFVLQHLVHHFGELTFC